MSSFLQSSAWKAFQASLGRPAYSDRGDGWSYVAFKESGTLNTRFYTPYGPECANARGFDAAIASLKARGAKEKATFIRVEPTKGVTANQLRARGFRPVTYQQLQPAHTQIIDLSQPEADILAQMSQNSRNITRNYHKKGITIRASHDPKDVTILTTLLSRVASRNHITAHSDSYFQAQANALFPTRAATLYIAEFEGKPIAAALVHDSNDTRTYAHAAADDDYRKLSAGTALVGQMILDAKAAGLTWFDLYGIANTDDPHHPWAGFTKFKKSFGGSPVTYPGAWDLPLNRFGYVVYRTYQTVYRRLRR